MAKTRTHSNNINERFRVFHRYLGFFLAGIMTIYALSGIVLIFRRTDIFKKEVVIITTIEPNLTDVQLGEKLRLKDTRFEPSENSIKIFAQGTYNTNTGEVNYTDMKYPFVMDKLIKFHKATTNDPMYYLNIFFGVALLFFAFSSFLMFAPNSKSFKKGVYVAIAGLIFAIVIVFL